MISLLFLLLSEVFASPCSIYLEPRAGGYYLHAERDGFTVGNMLYKVKGDTIHVSAVFVEKASRNTGVSAELFQHMIEQEPNATRLSGTLVMTNYLASGLQWRLKRVSEIECMRAARLTPFYKAAARLGFSGVGTCKHYPEMGYLMIELVRE